MWLSLVIPALLSAQADPVQGAARPVPNIDPPGQLQFYDEGSEQWLAPQLYLLRQRARLSEPWPVGIELPTEGSEGDRFRLIIRQGGCDLQFNDGQWRPLVKAMAWDDRLLGYDHCAGIVDPLPATDSGTDIIEPPASSL